MQYPQKIQFKLYLTRLKWLLFTIDTENSEYLLSYMSLSFHLTHPEDICKSSICSRRVIEENNERKANLPLYSMEM